MTENYLNILAETIRNNWDQPALTDFYLTEDGTAQDTSRGNHYTYGEMYAEICRVAELLTSLGLQKGDHIAICGANSAHWVIAYLAIAKMQGVSVTVMHSLMPDEIARLIDFSDAKALFTDEEIWEELKSLPLPQVENIISLENFESLASGTSIIASSASCPSSVSSASSETSASNASIVSFPQSSPEDLAMICFTSGTTSRPKGVKLSYRNISANLGYSADKNLLNNHGCHTNTISVLPMAHMFGLCTEILYSLYFGKHLNIVTFSTEENKNIRCFQIIKPLIVLLVPNILEKIIYNFKSISSKGNIRDMIYYMFGDEVESIAVSGAKMPREMEKILMDSNLPIIFGYGSTECIRIAESAMAEHRKGSAGKVLDTVECRISPAGEILVKGENVMLGYYKDPEATAQKIDSDGWLHTGDKGHLDEEGYLYVEGRLEQDIIVLPNGENIRPDNIESLINALPEVSESIVLARDGKLVAIVVPSIIENRESKIDLRRSILRTINPELPLYSQLYDVEITNAPLQKTEKQTIKRYLYK